MGSIAACKLQEDFLQREVCVSQSQQRPALAGEQCKQVAAQVVVRLALDGNLEDALFLLAEGVNLHNVLHAADGLQNFAFRAVNARNDAVLCGKVVRQRIRCAVRHKTAVVHDDHALAHSLHFGQDVGGQNNRVVSAEALDEVADLDDLLRVEANGGLVQNEDRRVAEQSLRNADTLLVALRQVADETSVDVVDLRQAADLAEKAGGILKIPMSDQVVKKTKATRSQKKLNAAERKQNLRMAFQATERLDGLRILVIDDVYTTGSTVEAMAECLLENGAKAVFFVTLCTGNI